jgi:hypothetical protein
MSSSFGAAERLLPTKKPVQQLIADISRRQPRVEMTMVIELGDVWSHSAHSTKKERGVGRFRTTPKAIEKWFTDPPPARIAMEAGTHSIWISSCRSWV